VTRDAQKLTANKFELTKWLWIIRHHSKIPLFKKKTLGCFSDTILLCFGANVSRSARENR